ncbi:hypothetical protein [Tessaracoccus antarcticus]|uniref:Uncharacterized protein n=1 Tax=Tessaracoccus antarcticus TaxID=2479848 RepID=A0A3M0G5L8_9ACTN|nr:hypothetical protein [Tessaracoccus antarcticus]RMB59858.1 hypothetical protein EAX62_08950 [Tessaracoccus antarcticus]
MSAWRGLVLRLGIGIAAASLVVALDGVVSLRVEPIQAFIAGTLAAVTSWVLTYLPPPGATTEWEQPSWHTRSPRLQADIRTRRLASVLAHAQPGRAFEARSFARTLALLTARRLVTSGRIPRPAEGEGPLASAAPHLSGALLTYLRSAESERPQVLNRTTLQAHLKEIDSL